MFSVEPFGGEGTSAHLLYHLKEGGCILAKNTDAGGLVDDCAGQAS